MNIRRRWILLLLVPLLVATQLVAQGLPTGTLAGRVTETEGLALPGVTVTVKSPALQGTRTAVTNVNGDFVVPNLPPGDYVVTFLMSGFQSATRNVRVSAGQQIPLNTKLSISAVAAETMVVAQSETVSQTSQAATTYSTELTNKLPVPRTITSAVALAPGVSYSTVAAGAPSISGAQSFDNVFTVNGVNIQDNIRGQPSEFLIIEDAVQETTTMTSGVSAEYGRFTGGVINAVTKQGGNSFSGSLRATLNNDNWQKQSPIERVYRDKVVPTYEATLGGPILKDRVWFFAAGRYNDNKYNGVTVAPTNISFPREDLDQRLEGKLTITPVQNHTLTGSYTWNEREATNYYFTSLPLLDPTTTTYDRQLPSNLLSINYNGVLGSNFFVEAQYSAKKFTFENSGSRFNELIKGTFVLVADAGAAQMYGAIFCAVCPGSSEKRDNEDILLKGTWFLSTKGLGSHNVVFGFDDFSTTRYSNNWQSGSSWNLLATSVQYDGTNLYPVVDENSYLAYWPIFALSNTSDMKTYSLFVNDTWRLNDRFSFNVGLRWDKNDAKDAGGKTTANDNAFSPRLAANWDVMGNGKLRLSASYATYVGQIQEGIAGSGATSNGAPATFLYYWYDQDPINVNSTGPWLTTEQVLARMFQLYGVTGLGQFPNRSPDYANVPGVNAIIRDSLKSPKTNEYVLGIGGTLGTNFVYRIDAVRREFKDFYSTKKDMSTGQVTAVLGGTELTYDLGLIVNSDTPEREYTGLHTSFGWRTGNLNLAASWTWSHLVGNFIGETSGSGPVTSGLDSWPEYRDLKWFAPRGSLAGDQRHRVRLVGSYDWRLGSAFTITPGLVQTVDTGTPYGAVGSAAVYPFVTDPGYAEAPNTNTYYFTPRDAYRTDTIYRTDLSLNLSANLGPVEIFVMPQVYNVFNSDGIQTVNTSVNSGTRATPNASTGLIRFNPFTTAPIECPQGATAAACQAAGANWQKGANFGRPTSATHYQIPMRYFVTMGIRF